MKKYKKHRELNHACSVYIIHTSEFDLKIFLLYMVFGNKATFFDDYEA